MPAVPLLVALSGDGVAVDGVVGLEDAAVPALFMPRSAESIPELSVDPPLEDMPGSMLAPEATALKTVLAVLAVLEVLAGVVAAAAQAAW